MYKEGLLQQSLLLLQLRRNGVRGSQWTQHAVVKIANSLGEGLEEFISEVSTRVANELIVDTDDRSFLQTMGDAGYSALMGAVVGGVVQTADGMIKSVRSDPKALAQQAADAAIAKFKAKTGDAAKPTLAQQIDSMRQQLADTQRQRKVDALMAAYEENVGAIEEVSDLDELVVDARDDFEKIIARGTTKIKQGFTAFSEKDILYERAKLVEPDGNKFDIAMHGTSTAVAFGGVNANMSPRLLASFIRHHEDYHGQEIRLLSCSTGQSARGEYCFAEELANALGTNVYAPNDLLYILKDGNIRIGKNKNGKFVLYKPNERKRLK